MVEKLIWRGKRPYWRSLHARRGGRLFSYVGGDEVPADIIAPDVLERMIAEGQIAVEETDLAAARSIAIHVDAAPIDDPAEPEPVQKMIEVDVGIMRATVDAGPDNLIGTADDLVDIRPIAEPDTTPDTAPVRRRKSSKRKR